MPRPASIPARAAALAFGLVLLAVAPAGASTTQYDDGSPSLRPRGFRVEQSAVAQVRDLWAASVREKRELVACLAGRLENGYWRLTRIEVLPSGGDSLGVSAPLSIERCGPPAWIGTIHTHVALRDGVRPYARFSGADRGIMRMWWRRWHAAGVFCLVYAPHEGRCEVDGQLVAGPGTRLAL